MSARSGRTGESSREGASLEGKGRGQDVIELSTVFGQVVKTVTEFHPYPHRPFLLPVRHPYAFL